MDRAPVLEDGRPCGRETPLRSMYHQYNNQEADFFRGFHREGFCARFLTPLPYRCDGTPLIPSGRSLDIKPSRLASGRLHTDSANSRVVGNPYLGIISGLPVPRAQSRAAGSTPRRKASRVAELSATLGSFAHNLTPPNWSKYKRRYLAAVPLL